MWFVLLEFNIFLLNVYVLYFIPLLVLGYGFCISLLNFKFSSLFCLFSSWFILRFLCSTKIVSHFLRNFCRTRFSFVRKADGALSHSLSHACTERVRNEESERVLSGNPFAHVDPKGWKISLSNYRTKIFFLFCILYSYWLVYPEIGGKVRGVIN